LDFPLSYNSPVSLAERHHVENALGAPGAPFAAGESIVEAVVGGSPDFVTRERN